MFWISDQIYLIVALATTFVIFFAVRGLRLPPRLFLIPDTLGLALFTIVGTQVALVWHAPWLVASLLGVITGVVVVGVLRDVLCNEVPLVFVRGELYAPAAWMGALLLIGLQTLGVSPVIAAWAGMATVLGVRLAAMCASRCRSIRSASRLQKATPASIFLFLQTSPTRTHKMAG